MAEALGGNGAPIDFNKYIAGEEALQVAARSLRSLSKDVTALSKTIADDSGRIATGFANIKQGIADIQGKALKLNLFSGEDKAVLAALAQQLGELKKRQEDYKATQTAQATVQRGLSDVTKQYTSELAKQKDALRAATLAQDVEGQKAAAAAIRQTTLESTQLSKALRGANSEFTAAKGSYDALVIENNKLLASLHGLEGGLQTGSQEAAKLKQQIFDNTETLKLFDQETNRSFRNVGNYAQSFSGLIAELAKARAAQAGYAEGSVAAAQGQMRIAGFQTAAQKAAAQAGLTYEQAEAKINGYTAAVQPLTTALVRLEKEQTDLAKTTGEDSEAYRKIGFQIQQTKKEIDEVATATVQAGDAQGGLSKQLGFTKEGLKDYATQLAVGAIGLQAIVQGVEAVFQANVAYSRDLAEVRKTTGLTADEAERLAQNLKALDTPTSLQGLLKIASVGGQLGIAKTDLLEFTKAIDTAVQALGNDFTGGAEEIATTLGKISTVFGKQLGPDAAQNILAIGSAVNQLGADGAATAPFLTDVALRVGAIASQSGLGLKDVLAYAAVLQETGFSAETSGTALNRFFSVLSTRTKEAFEIAKKANPALTLQEFTKLVNTDFNQAIQVFLKGLRSGNQSTTEISKELATLKLQSGEAKNAIITLAQNTELYAQRQATANDQLRDATSLAAEAAVNVDNAAGSFDKLKNEAGEVVTSGFLSTIIKGFLDIVRFDLGLLRAPFDALGEGIEYVKEKLGIAKPPLQDYAAAITTTALAAKKQADAQQQLLDSYTKLAGQAARTGAEEKQLSDLRAQLGTADVASVQQGIDARKAQFEGIKAQFHRDIDGLSQDIDTTNSKIAAAQEALLLRSQRITAQQLAQAKEIAQARLNDPNPVQGKSAVPELENAISANIRLLKATADLSEKERNRANLLAGLAKLEGSNTQANQDGAAAADKEAAAEERLGRVQVERAKNRLSDLRDSLADNQRNIDLLKKYQAEQGKLFEDGQLSSKVFAESVAGSQDLITKYERDGTAIRIKIARAEATEKLAEATKDRDRQLAAKKLSEAERTDIQGQYAERRKGIANDEFRDIEKIQQDAQQRQGAVEPLEFKVAGVDINQLKADLTEYVKTYEQKVADIKNAEQARSNELTEQLTAGTVTQGKFDDLEADNHKKANDAILALDKSFHQATIEDQNKANAATLADQTKADEADLAERRRVIAKRKKLLDDIGGYTQEAESAFFAIKGNFIDADIQRTQAAYDNEVKAAGENAELKAQIDKKYQKQLAKLAYDKAKAERDQAAISVAINTAVAVSKALAEFPFPFSLVPIGIALVQGALQEAVILSKPLPQYFKGRKGGPAELAIVGDRGPELVEHVSKAGGSRWEWAAKPTVTALSQGANVYTAAESSAMLAKAGLNHHQAQQPAQLAQAFGGVAHSAAAAREAASRGGYDELAKGQREIAAALRKFKPTSVHVHRGSEASVETSNNLTRYAAQRQFKTGKS